MPNWEDTIQEHLHRRGNTPLPGSADPAPAPAPKAAAVKKAPAKKAAAVKKAR